MGRSHPGVEGIRTPVCTPEQRLMVSEVQTVGHLQPLGMLERQHLHACTSHVALFPRQTMHGHREESSWACSASCRLLLFPVCGGKTSFVCELQTVTCLASWSRLLRCHLEVAVARQTLAWKIPQQRPGISASMKPNHGTPRPLMQYTWVKAGVDVPRPLFQVSQAHDASCCKALHAGV